ncbi:Flp pilus assembly protein, pilin Flp [Rhodovulum sp. P5]|uniref:hypothetical protein n=1 Tax=Rhodovulum sp. P5 TaxID=1564506 RepID=UPI0009C31F5A|nr:hypothetical protein [Rhodovulum sp. P5]ARE41390.1 Flp pilus assembly protein, pilin Flp [Rhodovulum sp. P5]
MKLFERIKNFRDDESGAVTVDWVVLTAAIVGLGVAVLSTVQGGVTSMAGKIQASLTGAEIVDLGTLGFEE